MIAQVKQSHSAMPGLVQHITTSLDVGGAQAMLVKLVEASARKRNGVRPAVLSLMGTGTFTKRLREAGCPTYTLGMARGLPGPLSVLRLLRITAMLRPDVLQGWMYHGNLAASVAGLAAGPRVPVLWNVRHSLADVNVEKASNRLLFKLSARLSGTPSAIVYNSRVAMREHAALGFDESRALHIPNGFDLMRYRPDPQARERVQRLFGMPQDAIVVGMIARNHPMKDHRMLVRALARARSAGHDLRLLLIGPGMDAPDTSLDGLIGGSFPGGTVVRAGERTDIADWLPGLDIVALSSAWGEAFPNILGEAMCCGVPCVATDVGDSAWVLGKGGVVVPPRNDEAMGAALARLAGMGSVGRRNLGALGRQRAASQFDLHDIAVRYRCLYASAVEHAARGSVRPSAALLASDAGVKPE